MRHHKSMSYWNTVLSRPDSSLPLVHHSEDESATAQSPQQQQQQHYSSSDDIQYSKQLPPEQQYPSSTEAQQAFYVQQTGYGEAPPLPAYQPLQGYGESGSLYTQPATGYEPTGNLQEEAKTSKSHRSRQHITEYERKRREAIRSADQQKDETIRELQEQLDRKDAEIVRVRALLTGYDIGPAQATTEDKALAQTSNPPANTGNFKGKSKTSRFVAPNKNEKERRDDLRDKSGITEDEMNYIENTPRNLLSDDQKKIKNKLTSLLSQARYRGRVKSAAQYLPNKDETIFSLQEQLAQRDAEIARLHSWLTIEHTQQPPEQRYPSSTEAQQASYAQGYNESAPSYSRQSSADQQYTSNADAGTSSLQTSKIEHLESNQFSPIGRSPQQTSTEAQINNFVDEFFNKRKEQKLSYLNNRAIRSLELNAEAAKLNFVAVETAYRAKVAQDARTLPGASSNNQRTNYARELAKYSGDVMQF